jgi:hypothetical protein
VDRSGNVCVADRYNSTIRGYAHGGRDDAGGTGELVRQRGWNRERSPIQPGAWPDNAGNVFVADLLNHTIRKVTQREVTTWAGSAETLGMRRDRKRRAVQSAVRRRGG